MGISDLIPGVSGGTIAFILGIYDELLASISGFLAGNGKNILVFYCRSELGLALHCFYLVG